MMFAAAKPQITAAPPQLQLKPRIGPVDDPLEREADAIADRVVSGGFSGAISSGGGVQRKCAACAAEEDEHIHRKASGPAPAQAQAAQAVSAVRTGGSPLTASQRAYFEPRFGRDLGGVRVHTGGQAAGAAHSINARAFTWGRDIAFAAGEFAPSHHEGRRLIAHELAHVLQQVPHIARQPAPYYTRTFRDDEGGDPLDYVETVQNAPSQTSAGIEGSVDRQVIAPANGSTPQQTTHRGRVNHIRLTPDCKLIVPYRIQFVQAAAGGHCQAPLMPNPMPAAQFQAIQTRYINAMNAGLNNRFALRISGCNTAQPCTNGPIPVVIEAQAVTNNPDRTINVVNGPGRADAATICAGSFSDELPMHEGGHQALGAADEYHETDPAIIAAANAVGLHWESGARERSDLSAMDDEYSYGRFTQFHQRHFYFAQAFMEAVLRGQGCSVSLESVQSTPVDFRLDLSAGGAGTNQGSMGYLSLFAGVGIPLGASRRLNLLLGAQGQGFSNSLSIPSVSRNALMGGLRVGLEAQTAPARFGLTGSLYATGGAFHAFASTPPAYTGLPSLDARTSPYGEVGGSLGVHLGMGSSTVFHVGAEGALGREFSDNPNALNWWRLGVVIGISR